MFYLLFLFQFFFFLNILLSEEDAGSPSVNLPKASHLEKNILKAWY